MKLFPLALALAACTPPAAAAPAPSTTSSGDHVPEVEAFRAELADPARHPFRHGLAIDDQEIKDAVAGFAASHRELLAQHFRVSLDALPTGTVPAAPEYGVAAELASTDSAAYAETTELYYRLAFDGKTLARLSMNIMLPRLAQNLGLDARRIGAWMGFLGTAIPDTRVCQRDAQILRLCLDYGRQDIFVVGFHKTPSDGWAGDSLAWYQRGRTTGPK